MKNLANDVDSLIEEELTINEKFPPRKRPSRMAKKVRSELHKSSKYVNKRYMDEAEDEA